MILVKNYVDWILENPNPQWMEASRVYREIDLYFYGDVFLKTSSENAAPGASQPLYPLKVNLVKMMALVNVFALFGQWETDVVEWSSDSDEAEGVIRDIWHENDLNLILAECGMSCVLYGGGILKAVPDMDKEMGVRIETIPPHHFFPRWHPGDMNRLLEVTIAFPVSHADALLAYGVDLGEYSESQAVYMEVWNQRRYETSVGGNVLKEYSGDNPFGFVPFVYIPRLRAPGEFYGLSAVRDVIGIQDELNLRLADIGDRINYNAHPIFWVSNFTGKTKDLVVAQDEVWNLGSGMNGMEPKAGVLEPRSEPSASFQYIQVLIDLSRMSALAPAVAFGEDEGSQRSALTLALRMWPLVQQAKWTRMYWHSQLVRLNRYILRIYNRNAKLLRRPQVEEAIVYPRMAPILPKDRDQLVQEINTLWNSRLPLISAARALERLGEDDIEEELKRLELLWQVAYQTSSSSSSSETPTSSGTKS